MPEASVVHVQAEKEKKESHEAAQAALLQQQQVAP